MGPNRFLSIRWGPKDISNTQEMLFENFIHFENLTFFKFQSLFLNFDVFHSKEANFCKLSNPIGFFYMDAQAKPS